MHTMKLDALLYKPRIKVLRMINEGVGWSQQVMGGGGGVSWTKFEKEGSQYRGSLYKGPFFQLWFLKISQF